MVSAGAAGIGLEIARAFVARARACTCATWTRQAMRATRQERSGDHAHALRRVRPRAGAAFRRGAREAGRPRLPGEQRRHRGADRRVEEIDPAEWDRCLAIDLTGQFNCVRLAVPHLRKRKNASIVNVSSLAGRLGFALRTPYAAAKWGVVGFTKSLAVELGGRHPRERAPARRGRGRADQPRARRQGPGARGISSEEMMEERSRSSRRTNVTPQQIADRSCSRSPRGRTISGQAISVCGDTQMLP